MTRPRKITDDQIRIAISSSKSFREAYLKVSASINSSSGYQNFRKRVVGLGIDYSHFGPRPQHTQSNWLSWEQVLVYDRNQTGTREDSPRLRWAMLESGVEWRCSDCGNTGEWNGLPMLLEIDHIDGNGLNNTKENLRFLCPNCHSMYSNSKSWRPLTQDKNGLYTLRGGDDRRRKSAGTEKRSSHTQVVKPPRYKKKCVDCGVEIGKSSERCQSCGARARARHKIEWPPDARLEALVWEHPMTELSKLLGVSDRAIKKRCVSRNIDLPEFGHWNRVHAARMADK